MQMKTLHTLIFEHTSNCNALNLLADCLTYLLVVPISGSCYIFFINSRRFYLNKCCELKQRFLHVWHCIDQTIIDEWHERLRACIRAKGGHFEQLL